MRFCRALSLCLILATASGVTDPPLAAAQAPLPASDPAADSYRQHMDFGISFYEQKNYAAAIAEFQEAYKVKPKASPLVNMALCHKALFAYTRAIRALQTALDKHADTMDENDKKAARTEIADMRARLSYVTFKVTPEGASVRIDGEPSPEASQGNVVELDPGGHRVEMSNEGFATEDQTVTLASGQRTLEYALKPNMGFVKIKADGPKHAIAIDQTPMSYGEWSGLLGPGSHVIEMYLPGSPAPSYRVRLDVEVGKTYEVARGKGGVPLTGTNIGSQTPLPPPPPPKVPEKPVTGFFGLATVSLYVPMSHPAAFNGESPSGGVLGGARLGYRVNTPVSFDFMVGYLNLLVKKEDHQDVSYNLEELRLGVNMRLQTPGKTARFYGSFGGGLVYESLEFSYKNLLDCVNPQTPVDNVTPTCKSGDGVDGYGLLEMGLQFSLGVVLLDLSVGSALQSVRSFPRDDDVPAYTYTNALLSFEAGLRVGYAAW